MRVDTPKEDHWEAFNIQQNAYGMFEARYGLSSIITSETGKLLADILFNLKRYREWEEVGRRSHRFRKVAAWSLSRRHFSGIREFCLDNSGF